MLLERLLSLPSEAGRDGVGGVCRAGALERRGAVQHGERHAARALRLAAARVMDALWRDIPVVTALRRRV
eukprot:scaffold122786_cov60-Phaeocystis_antarctica.AAC.1